MIRPGLLYYGYVLASVGDRNWLTIPWVSVICSLNLLNIIVLVVRHFLGIMCFYQSDAAMLCFVSR